MRMNNMGYKIAAKRKDMGMTQIEFAEKLSVTRQTVSRWEAGTVMPDIDKIPDIATILGVSCDYLLKDGQEDQENNTAVVPAKTVSRLLESIRGKKVKLSYCEDQEDIDLFDRPVTVEDFEGNWMKISSVTKKGETLEKLIPVSSILSFEIVKGD